MWPDLSLRDFALPTFPRERALVTIIGSGPSNGVRSRRVTHAKPSRMSCTREGTYTRRMRQTTTRAAHMPELDAKQKWSVKYATTCTTPSEESIPEHSAGHVI